MVDRTLLDKELDELYKEVSEGIENGEKIGETRRFLAYTLKIIAGGGSLIIATGQFPNADQWIGIGILIAVFIDTVFSNHKRLISIVEAGYAFRSLKNRIKGEYNRKLDPLIKRKNQGDEKVEKEIDKLKQKTHEELSNEIGKIQKELDKTDIEALKALSLERERSQGN